MKKAKDLNQLPAKNGISDIARPSTLITGRARLNYVQVNKLNFDDYIQRYINKGETNTNKSRTVRVTVICPSGNEQGGGLCH